jgi:hypothetical protein
MAASTPGANAHEVTNGRDGTLVAASTNPSALPPMAGEFMIWGLLERFTYSFNSLGTFVGLSCVD